MTLYFPICISITEYYPSGNPRSPSACSGLPAISGWVYEDYPLHRMRCIFSKVHRHSFLVRTICAVCTICSVCTILTGFTEDGFPVSVPLIYQLPFSQWPLPEISRRHQWLLYRIRTVYEPVAVITDGNRGRHAVFSSRNRGFLAGVHTIDKPVVVSTDGYGRWHGIFTVRTVLACFSLRGNARILISNKPMAVIADMRCLAARW